MDQIFATHLQWLAISGGRFRNLGYAAVHPARSRILEPVAIFQTHGARVGQLSVLQEIFHQPDVARGALVTSINNWKNTYWR